MTRARSSRRHGAATMVWLFFADIFEPAKVAATEQIDIHRRIRPDATRATGPADPRA